MKKTEKLITNTIKIAGSSSILFVMLIFIFLVREGVPALQSISLESLFSVRWYPIEDLFGILPLISGSLIVTVFSILIALPFGIGTAIYIGEIAPQRVNEILKPLVEILAGIPSVVLGFIGILVLSPLMRTGLNLPTGLTALTGAILLALISIPTIVSLTEDALYAVPESYREAAYAVGATKWQVIWHIVVPAARSGILNAVMLGIGRSLGETMAVMMVTGNAPTVFTGLQSFIAPVRTMTATIASEMGEVATGSAHYQVLFFIGIILFLFSLVINITSSSLSMRPKRGKRPGSLMNLISFSRAPKRRMNRNLVQKVGFNAIRLITLVTILPILGIVVYIAIKGWPAISWEFLSAMPRDGMRAGGILPAIIGTLYLMVGTAVISIPLGISAGIYLSEYATDNWWTRLIRIAIISLAGVPSVVYGLFGLGLFVLFFNFGISIISAALTLSIMTLPVIISTTEEAMRSVPYKFRIVGISLGGTQWQTIRKVILPQALPGILTGIILGLERAVGETAPILFTGATFFLPHLPTSPMDATMALPYHIYVISTQIPGMPITIQYGTVLVLLVFVLAMNLIASVIRSRARAKRQW